MEEAHGRKGDVDAAEALEGTCDDEQLGELPQMREVKARKARLHRKIQSHQMKELQEERLKMGQTMEGVLEQFQENKERMLDLERQVEQLKEREQQKASEIRRWQGTSDAMQKDSMRLKKQLAAVTQQLAKKEAETAEAQQLMEKKLHEESVRIAVEQLQMRLADYESLVIEFADQASKVIDVAAVEYEATELSPPFNGERLFDVLQTVPPLPGLHDNVGSALDPTVSELTTRCKAYEHDLRLLSTRCAEAEEATLRHRAACEMALAEAQANAANSESASSEVWSLEQLLSELAAQREAEARSSEDCAHAMAELESHQAALDTNTSRQVMEMHIFREQLEDLTARYARSEVDAQNSAIELEKALTELRSAREVADVAESKAATAANQGFHDLRGMELEAHSFAEERDRALSEVRALQEAANIAVEHPIDASLEEDSRNLAQVAAFGLQKFRCARRTEILDTLFSRIHDDLRRQTRHGRDVKREGRRQHSEAVLVHALHNNFRAPARLVVSTPGEESPMPAVPRDALKERDEHMEFEALHQKVAEAQEQTIAAKTEATALQARLDTAVAAMREEAAAMMHEHRADDHIGTAPMVTHASTGELAALRHAMEDLQRWHEEADAAHAFVATLHLEAAEARAALVKCETRQLVDDTEPLLSIPVAPVAAFETNTLQERVHNLQEHLDDEFSHFDALAVAHEEMLSLSGRLREENCVLSTRVDEFREESQFAVHAMHEASVFAKSNIAKDSDAIRFGKLCLSECFEQQVRTISARAETAILSLNEETARCQELEDKQAELLSRVEDACEHASRRESALNSELATLTSQGDFLRGQVGQLRAEVAQATCDAAIARGDLPRVESKISMLSATLEAALGDRATLESRIEQAEAFANSEYSYLRRRCAEYESNLQAVIFEKVAATESLTDLSARYEKAEQVIHENEAGKMVEPIGKLALEEDPLAGSSCGSQHGECRAMLANDLEEALQRCNVVNGELADARQLEAHAEMVAHEAAGRASAAAAERDERAGRLEELLQQHSAAQVNHEVAIRRVALLASECSDATTKLCTVEMESEVVERTMRVRHAELERGLANFEAEASMWRTEESASASSVEFAKSEAESSKLQLENQFMHLEHEFSEVARHCAAVSSERDAALQRSARSEVTAQEVAALAHDVTAERDDLKVELVKALNRLDEKETVESELQQAREQLVRLKSTQRASDERLSELSSDIGKRNAELEQVKCDLHDVMAARASVAEQFVGLSAQVAEGAEECAHMHTMLTEEREYAAALKEMCRLAEAQRDRVLQEHGEHYRHEVQQAVQSREDELKSQLQVEAENYMRKLQDSFRQKLLHATAGTRAIEVQRDDLHNELIELRPQMETLREALAKRDVELLSMRREVVEHHAAFVGEVEARAAKVLVDDGPGHHIQEPRTADSPSSADVQAKITAENDDLRRTLEHVAQRLNASETKASALDAQLEWASSRVDTCQGEIEEKDAVCDMLRQQLVKSSADRDTLAHELMSAHALSSDNLELKSEVEQVRELLTTSVADRETLRNQLQAAAEDFQLQTTRLKAQLDDSASRCAEFHQLSREQQGTVHELGEVLAQTTADRDKLQARLAVAERCIEEEASQREDSHKEMAAAVAATDVATSGSPPLPVIPPAFDAQQALAEREALEAAFRNQMEEVQRELSSKTMEVQSLRQQFFTVSQPKTVASSDISASEALKRPEQSMVDKLEYERLSKQCKDLQRRVQAVEEEKTIMLHDMREHILQLARENFDLKSQTHHHQLQQQYLGQPIALQTEPLAMPLNLPQGGSRPSDTAPSQSTMDIPNLAIDSSVNKVMQEEPKASGGWLSYVLSPFLTDSDLREIHAESIAGEAMKGRPLVSPVPLSTR
mmetsp:Transcript_51915/g.151203  ORF Transcript_51915/g.151203 Transcript_51915/m.151203 type:complete len:1884 (+) Transcript_51915:170-5821(+)